MLLFRYLSLSLKFIFINIYFTKAVDTILVKAWLWEL